MVAHLSGRALLGQIEAQEKKIKSGKLSGEALKACETYLEVLKVEANARVAKLAQKVKAPEPVEAPVESPVEAPKPPKGKKAKADA